jgi:glycosyltransferase involved in cell wall biosynthesis
MRRARPRTAFVIASAFGQPTCDELARQAAAGERPRKDYVELCRALDAELIDGPYMAERATVLARLLARHWRFPIGQVAEVFLRQRRYDHILAWGDRLGLPLALLGKLTLTRRDLVMLAQWTSRGKKGVFLSRLRAHTHLRAMVHSSAVQMAHAAEQLGVPEAKLLRYHIPVDDRYWQPSATPTENLICSVGVEGRDYGTLIETMRGLDIAAELGAASTTATGSAALRAAGLDTERLPPNIRLSSPTLPELRALYARSRFVVIPLQDTDYDAGSTVATEAMAMGKAVIITRTRGHSDIIAHGEHGLFVPPGDPAALRAAIERLTANPAEAERMGRAGRALVEERHAMDRFVAHIVGIVHGGEHPLASPATPGPVKRSAEPGLSLNAVRVATEKEH